MEIVGRGLFAGERVDAAGHIGRVLPDRHASAHGPAHVEPLGHAGAIVLGHGPSGPRVPRHQSGAAGFESVKLGPRREDIGRIDLDILERPAQHGADDRLGNARRGVLGGRWRPAGNAVRRTSTPRQETDAAAG